MSTVILLIRHAAHEELGVRLSGRGEAPGLSARGQAEVDRLCAFLAGCPIAAIHASPRLRAQQTAAALARVHGLDVQTAEALDEVDFGDWTGQRYDELDGQPDWDQWNAARSTARPPDGESMVEAQQRAVAHVHAAARDHPNGCVGLVSHCDVIRSVIAGALGLTLDNILRFDVEPASVSRLVVTGDRITVAGFNEGVFA